MARFVERTETAAKAAARKELLTKTDRKRLSIIYQSGDADCGCGQTYGIRAVGFPSRVEVVHSAIYAVCKKCG